MQVIRTAKEIISYAEESRNQGKVIGFVPTMGALHEGHLDLVRQSMSETNITICSIFVNPTQFNESADFDKYPRTIESDTEKLRDLGCDILFCPSVDEVYPKPDKTIYNLGEVSNVLEGEMRPGHFNGMASVVKRLFELTLPHRAYFGLKDFQQCLVVKELVRNYNLPVEVITCPTVREPSGLAMSSRNKLLSEEGKKTALQIYRTLQALNEQWTDVEIEQLQELGLSMLSSDHGIDLEYIEIRDSKTLISYDRKSHNAPVVLIAARVEGVRLIDNMILQK